MADSAATRRPAGCAAAGAPVAGRTRGEGRADYEGAYQVRWQSDIGDIDRAEWDSLVNKDDIQASHRFVGVCQRSGVENADYRHLMVYHDGRLEAIATLCRMVVSLDLLSPAIVRAVGRQVRRRYPSFLKLPVVFCGLPVSFAQSCLRLHSCAHTNTISRLVAEHAENWAAESSTPLVCFKEFTTAETKSITELSRLRFFRAASLPSCSLPISWNSFDEYVNAMRSGYRRQLNATLQARTTGNLELRLVEDFGHECPRIFELYEQVMDRVPFQLERLNLAFFELLDEELGSASRALLVERRGELLAAAVLLYTSRTVTFLLAGIDYERAPAHHAYLNLVTEVVAEAIRGRAQLLELGQTSYHLKRRLGARTSDRSLFLRYRSRAGHVLLKTASRLLFPQTSLPNRHVFREP